MKNLIRQLIFFIFTGILLSCTPAFSISLSGEEVVLMNELKVYLDQRPEGNSIRLLQQSLKHKNPAVKGLVSLILYKHFGRKFRNLVLRNFTCNLEVDKFEQAERKLIRLEHVNKLLEAIQSNSKSFLDERLQKIFLFFHLRQKNVWLRGTSGEILSLAVFYRIAVFDHVFDSRHDPIRLSVLADSKKIY